MCVCVCVVTIQPSRLYSYGEYKAEDQEQMLAQLDKKVADVYTKTIGPNEANIPYELHVMIVDIKVQCNLGWKSIVQGTYMMYFIMPL